MELHGSSFSDHACNPVIVCQSHLPSLIDNEKADTGTIGHHTLFIQHRLIDHWTAFQRSRKLEVLDWKWTPDGHLIDTWWTPDGHLMDTWTILKESNKQSTPAVSHMFFLQVAQRMAQLRATPPSATSGLRNEMTQKSQDVLQETPIQLFSETILSLQVEFQTLGFNSLSVYSLSV